MRCLTAVALAFISGAVALAYEVLWNRVCGNILGDTIFNSTVVLVVFFVALSAGAILFRIWKTVTTRPWLAFGALQFGIGIMSLPSYFVSGMTWFPGYGMPCGFIKGCIDTAMIALIVGPPAFCMGGTLLPLIEATKDRFGRSFAAVLYGVNTVGGLLGIYAVTFHLIYIVGIHESIGGLVRITMTLAAVASACQFFFRRFAAVPAAGLPAAAVPLQGTALLHLWAGLSGALILGFEIIFLHASALVNDNSSWSFGIMLMLVIGLLGAAALLAAFLRSLTDIAIRYGLGLIIVLLVMFPFMFYCQTAGLSDFFQVQDSITAYVVGSIWTGLRTAGPFLFAAGFLFPLILMRAGGNARLVGSLFAVNACGALAGALVAGMVLIPLLGVWKASVTLGVIGLSVWIFAYRERFARPADRLFSLFAAAVVGAVGLAAVQQIPLMSVSRSYGQLAVASGVEGVVGVQSTPQKTIVFRFNNHFVLSAGANALFNQLMSHIPLLMHPRPARVGYIGLATGFTASGSVLHNAVGSIDIAEISPLIIRMCREYCAPIVGNFDRDPRVSIYPADGVNYFATTDRIYDVIISDLFFPWQQGAARLYTSEHFRNIYSRLSDGGIFCLWIPIYQFSMESVEMVGRTFNDVFDAAVCIVVQYYPAQHIAAFIGRKRGAPGPVFDKGVWDRRKREEHDRIRPALQTMDGLYRIFVVDIMRGGAEEGELNTLDMPLLEQMSVQIYAKLGRRVLRVKERPENNNNGRTFRSFLEER